MLQENPFSYQYYGAKVGPVGLIRFLEHSIQNHLARGLHQPICIWGRHGIGKTEIVERLAADRGFRFRYIAPAQFEEMGDLTGMPAIEGNQTVFRAPAWAPSDEGPGILLIDDVNRADDRILRGIMQLLLRHELVSWRLPQKWQIILTANPDGGDYSVTPMDDALLTRMLHITLEFDPRDWISWASAAGIDPRYIRFIQSFPESVTGLRTTPRTLVQFFNAINGLDWQTDHNLIRILGEASLDTATVASFLYFIQNQDASLPTGEAVLNSENFETEIAPALRFPDQNGTGQLELVSRQVIQAIKDLEEITPLQVGNFRAFLTLPGLPGDLRLKILQELNHHPSFGVLVEGGFLEQVLVRKYS